MSVSTSTKERPEMAVIENSTATRTVTIDSLIDEQERIFLERMPQSIARSEEASAVLAGGATSNWMISRPAAVWVSHGQGSMVWDVDGTEYVDLHGGYGVMVAGHANPAVVAAVQRRVDAGHALRPTDRRRDRRRPTSWPTASGCRCGGSTTPAPRRRWMPST